MVKWIFAAAASTSIVLTIWFASPYVALHSIQLAISANDAEVLSTHVDYEVLRENVKSRLSNYLTDGVAPNVPGMFKQRLIGLAAGVIDTVVATYITPEMLQRLMQAKPVGNSSENGAVDIQHTWDVKWYTKRTGLDEVVLHVMSTNPKYEEKEVLIYFRRISGLTWKVVDLDPADWKQWALQRFNSHK